MKADCYACQKLEDCPRFEPPYVTECADFEQCEPYGEALLEWPADVT